jgi:D-3-phosphoglycerate dehydrogenase / 2-oxoglutarate reductase
VIIKVYERSALEVERDGGDYMASMAGPGAVRALGGLLGREDINISRKRVGVDGESAMAIALISISAPLSAKAMAEIRELPPIQQAVEFEL